MGQKKKERKKEEVGKKRTLEGRKDGGRGGTHYNERGSKNLKFIDHSYRSIQ
jgi:hypothetical protein